MVIIKEANEEMVYNTNCINHNGGDDQYNESDGSGVNCGGSVTD